MNIAAEILSSILVLFRNVIIKTESHLIFIAAVKCYNISVNNIAKT